jgi:hypothetical protein
MADPLEALIAEIYDAAVDPLLWPIFLERLRARLGAEFVSIVSIHQPTVRVAHVHHTPWDAAAISDLANHQLVRVPMREKILFGMLDTPVSTLQLMPEDEFQRSSFHRDWVAPNGLRDGSTTLIADMAEELISIGANTVKTHLARIFAKTGCGRQADLVRLMSELSLPTQADTSRRLQRRVNGTGK